MTEYCVTSHWAEGQVEFLAEDLTTNRWGLGFTEAAACVDLEESNAEYLADLEDASPCLSPRLERQLTTLRKRHAS